MKIVCWIKGHIWKFNGGDPICSRCGIYQYGKPTRIILPVIKNENSNRR